MFFANRSEEVPALAAETFEQWFEEGVGLGGSAGLRKTRTPIL